MRIEDLKRWHWIVIGLVVGLVLAYVQVQASDNGPPSGSHLTTVRNFEPALHGEPVQGNPRLRGIMFYKLGDAYVVDMQMIGFKGPRWSYEPRQLYLRTLPYKPRIPPEGFATGLLAWARPNRAFTPPRQDYSVVNYLEDVAKHNPKVTFRHAWWKESKAVELLWTLGSVLIIGGVWPIILNLLMGAGFGRTKKEPAYDLHRFKSEESSATTKAAPPSPEDDAKLRAHVAELDRQVEASLNHSTPTTDDEPPTTAADQSTPAAIPTLSAGPLEPATTPALPAEPKNYQGEFYPVSRPTGSKNAGAKTSTEPPAR